MKFGMYSVFDRLSGYSALTMEVNDQVAYRNFEHAVLNGGTVLFSHAQDYELHRLGYFDSDSGEIRSHRPETIAQGSSIVLSSLRKDDSDEI